ncbi:MAG TPA: DUF167 domain-containing protein [Candidatus Methanomethylophilaceae archaeon]|nr:DUF167 domain-containing protein [Candidatus Methanomethylophilaceae archaeon]
MGKMDNVQHLSCLMELSDVTRITSEGLELNVYVSPRSSKPGLDGFDEWRNRLIIRVKAPPLDGKANKEVETLIKKITGMKASVTSGMTDRRKTIRIEGDVDIILKKLEDSM